MVTRNRELNPKEISAIQIDHAKPMKAKFRVFGEELIEKEVKPSGSTGRIYLPPDWVGKHVKIIRID